MERQHGGGHIARHHIAYFRRIVAMRLYLELLEVHEEQAKLLLSGTESLREEQIWALIDWLKLVAAHMRNPKVHHAPSKREYD